LKVFIQTSTDGLFLKGEGVWAALKEEALDFKNCTPAIDFCVKHSLRNVRLWLSFDDPKYDFPMEIFRAETAILMRRNEALREKGRALQAQVDQIGAEVKERKKQLPFRKADIGEAGRNT